MKKVQKFCSVVLIFLLLFTFVSSAFANAEALFFSETDGIEQSVEAIETDEDTPEEIDENIDENDSETDDPDSLPDPDETDKEIPDLELFPDEELALLAEEIQPNSTITWTQYGRAGHSSVNGDKVSFSGHPVDPFTTLLFCDATDGDYRFLTFHLSEGVSDWHTLEGTGFMFNCGISDGKINGYAVLFGQTNVSFAKLTNVNISALTNTTFLSIPGVSVIDNKPKPSYSQGTTWFLRLVMSPGSLKVEKYSDTGFTQLAETIFSSALNDPSGGTGYGPFASFVSHNCDSISTSSLEYFHLDIKPNTPPTLEAEDVTLDRGETFNAMDGVTAQDAEDDDLTASVTVLSNNVNVQIPGVYQVVYAVSDLAGASVNHTRNVTVRADAIFLVTNVKTGGPIQGVGISMSEPVGILPDTDAKGESFIALSTGGYQWKISKQHPDYLSLMDVHNVLIESDSATEWPLIIPVQLEKKYCDASVTLAVKSINGKAVQNGDTAKYNDVVVFSLTAKNNGNQAVTPSFALTFPDAMSGEKAAAFPSAINPDESASIDLSYKITTLDPAFSIMLSATLDKLILAENGSVVSDENSANNMASADFSVENIPTTLTKTDALNGETLAGVKLRILSGNTPIKVEKISDGTWAVSETGAEIIPTDNQGKITVYGLAPGSYHVEEVMALSGYALPSSTWKFERDENSETKGDTTLRNEPTAFVLTITDDYTQTAFENVEFSLCDNDGKAIKFIVMEDGSYRPDDSGSEILVSNKDGKITIRYLPVDSYSLAAVPQVGYLPVPEMPLIITDSHIISDPAKVTIANVPTAFVLMKTDDYTKLPVENVGFSVIDTNGKAIKFTKLTDSSYKPDGNGNETIFTNKDGKITVRYLPLGFYKVIEHLPKGYIPNEDKEIEIKSTHSAESPAVLTIVNKPTAFILSKSDSYTQKPLENVSFSVFDASGKAVKFTKLIDGSYKPDDNGDETIFTNNDGKITVRYLPIGSYVAVERLHDGYLPITDVPFEIAETHFSDAPAKLTIENVPTAFILTKTDAYSRKPLENVGFSLLDADGKVVKLAKLDDGSYKPTENGDEIVLTDKDGKICVRYLPIGLYAAKEYANAGYASISDAKFEITETTSAESPATLSVENAPTEVILTKTDAYSKRPLENVGFLILDANGNAIKFIKSSDTTYEVDANGEETVYTSYDGEIIIHYLPIGRYTAKEILPSGYVYAGDKQFEVTTAHSTDNPATIEVANIPTRMILEKLDATTKKPLDGAVFRLLDVNGNRIPLMESSKGVYYCDPKGKDDLVMDNGFAYVFYLPIGKITIEEVTPPIGYNVAQAISTEITNSHTMNAPLRIIIEDKPIALSIRKVTKENQPLSGAGFSIKKSGFFQKALTFHIDEEGIYRYDENGTETTILVNEIGEALVYGLPVGTYVLEEKIVPAGYAPATPQKVILTTESDTDSPYEAVIVNEIFVQLGFDSDRIVPYVAAGLLIVAIGACVYLFITLRTKKVS